MVKDDYLGFRDGIKAEEQVLDLRLEPEAVEVYGEDRDAAVAHSPASSLARAPRNAQGRPWHGAGSR